MELVLFHKIYIYYKGELYILCIYLFIYFFDKMKNICTMLKLAVGALLNKIT